MKRLEPPTSASLWAGAAIEEPSGEVGCFCAVTDNVLAWLTTDHVELVSAVVTAVATAVMAVFTWRLTESNKLAREEFIATHRPRIAVRAFRLHMESLGASHKCPVEFIYLNEGETAAHIKEIGTALINRDFPWTYGNRNIRFDVEAMSQTLPPGAELLHLTKSHFNFDEQDTNWFCVGYIVYRDDRGITRRTGFCRRRNRDTQDWHREQNEDWEYSY